MIKLKTNYISERINYLFLLAVLIGISSIITMTLVLQFGLHQIPCPLCLLQRVAFFGAGFGIILSLRSKYSPSHTACVQVFMAFLLVVSVRQCMNHIVAGRSDWIGGLVLGLHLSVWSVVIALVILLLFSLQLMAVSVTGVIRRHMTIDYFPRIRRLGKVVGWYLVGLCIINLGSVIVQCGFGICHTFRYSLLNN